MEGKPCAEIYAEIEKLIEATPSVLCWSIARELADYTVAFVLATNDLMISAGSGTLVSFNNSDYILTAAHVWDALRAKDRILIPLKENGRSRFGIDPREIAPFVIKSEHWNEYGPDLALLRLPPERAGSLSAIGRPFFPLSKGKMRTLSCAVETWFLMGAPAVRGEYAKNHAVPELQGMNVILGDGPFFPLNTELEFRSDFDFVDIPIDTTQKDVAWNFEGVSGGGLWRVYVYKDSQTGRFESFKSLQGVAFWQDPIEGGLRVRCHGPQSIGSMLHSFVNADETK